MKPDRFMKVLIALLAIGVWGLLLSPSRGINSSAVVTKSACADYTVRWRVTPH